MNLTLRLAGVDFGVAYALPVWALCELFSWFILMQGALLSISVDLK